MLRPVDVLEQQAPHLALLLLPEASEPEVLSLAEALHRSEPGLYRVGASVFPTLASSAEELIADSLRAARDARAQQVNFSRTVAPSAQRAGEPIVIAPSMKRVHALIASAARTTIPVLIAGETGSGKESLATAVHHLSARRKGPLKTVNCAALPSALISSTLFGHEKGAFTGADRQSLGLFEQADGGTLFLDEVGELSLEAQAALLRALETKRIVRVGGNKEIEVDVRLVAATHRDLSAMVVLGTFREDLLYRLDAFTVRVPPLRERREEIIPLAQHFLALSQARWHSSATTLAEAVGHTLERYAWPGNARQLRNVIERAAAVCRGSVIELDDLPDAIFDTSRAAPQTQPPTRPIPTASVSSSLPDRLRQIEEQILREALDKAGGNQSEAARSLGLPRRTLAHKVHAYGLAATSERPA
jgi:DNA-binding NtrC family response regulator